LVSRPIDIPLARAASHLAAARYAEAAGAYRAVLCIDPQAYEAHLGLADCAVGRGQLEEAIEDLVGAAQDFAEREALQPAFALMTKALMLAPARLELHIDVAELEAAAGRIDMATSRLHNLARAYESEGEYDEAEAVRQAAAAFAAMDGPSETDTAVVAIDPEAANHVTVVEPDRTVEVVVGETEPPGRITAIETGPPRRITAIETGPPRRITAIETGPARPITVVPTSAAPDPASLVTVIEPEVARASEAVPVAVAPSHTVPQYVPITTEPPARTGDTFVGQPPGPRPRAEQSVARTVARRAHGPALRWRPSTIQMKALTAEIPSPNALAAAHAGVPKKVVPMRTAPIVHAPSRSTSTRPQVSPAMTMPARPGPAHRIAAAPRPTLDRAAAMPAATTSIKAKPVETPVAAKPVAAKPIAAKSVAATPVEPARADARARKLEIRRLPGRPRPRPAASTPKFAEPPSKLDSRSAARTPAPKRKPIAASPARKPEPSRKQAPAKQAEPSRKPIAAPTSKREPMPPRRQETESLAERLRRHSSNRRDVLAAKVKRIAAAEKQRATTSTFEEDATNLWCPEHLQVSDSSLDSVR
jgi:hypothetical protein